MSKENAKKFYEALKADKALAEELQNALKAQKIENDNQAKQAVIAFAGNKGFAFTAEELAELETEASELSDDELDRVSAAASWCGGAGSGWCFVIGAGKGGGCFFAGGKGDGKVKCIFSGQW